MNGRAAVAAFRPAAVVLIAALLLAACGTPAPDPAEPRPLRVLVVNDDGWNAPGIGAVRQALVAAGHTVTVVAPARNESGTGAALTSGPLQVAEETPGVWSVAGRPADSALVGLRSVLASSPPDLVVSGINSGYNVGATTVHSGTVGAALTAAEFGVPAVAVSTDVADPARPSASDFGRAADFAARLVGELSGRPAPLLPPGAILNVNYPEGRDAAAGVVATEVATVPQVDITYVESGPGQLTPKPESITPTDGSGGTDLAALARNEVSVGALSTDFAAGGTVTETAEAVAAAVAP